MKKNKIDALLLGRGQLGNTFFTRSHRSECFKISFLDRSYYPVTDSDAIAEVIAQDSQKVIINTAALTNVELSERKPVLAGTINCHGVAQLAKLAKKHDLLLVHFSTDYVFDGIGNKSWQESDIPKPLNVYGQSKLLGEQAIIASGCQYLIIRTSWLHSIWRENFLKTMLRLAQSSDELRVVCDQVGAPTSAIMLAEVTLQAVERVLVKPELGGLYHVAASGAVSWYDYARFIFSEAFGLGLIDKMPHLLPVTSKDYGGMVKRPLNSQLDTRLFQQTFDLTLPDWQSGVRSTLQMLLQER